MCPRVWASVGGQGRFAYRTSGGLGGPRATPGQECTAQAEQDGARGRGTGEAWGQPGGPAGMGQGAEAAVRCRWGCGGHPRGRPGVGEWGSSAPSLRYPEPLTRGGPRRSGWERAAAVVGVLPALPGCVGGGLARDAHGPCEYRWGRRGRGSRSGLLLLQVGSKELAGAAGPRQVGRGSEGTREPGVWAADLG